jgi:RHS repeat-associated protein
LRSLAYGSLLAISVLAAPPTAGHAATAPSSVSADQEVPELATAKSRAFRRDDGSVIERIYGGAVNYRDAAGTWRHIDTDLKRDGQDLQTTAGDVVAQIPSTLGNTDTTVSDGTLSASLKPLDLTGDATVNDATATFADAAPGLDLKLSALSTGLQHTTVLEGSDAPAKLEFDLQVSSGATVKANADGSATITSQDGKRELQLSPSFGWVDNDTKQTRSVQTTVAKQGGGWRVHTDLGASWIRDALRDGKKVTVDPTLTVPSASKHATFFSQDPTLTGYASATTRVLAGRISTGEGRSALQFNVDTVPQGARVLDATIGLHGSASAGDAAPHKLSLHAITANWDGAQTSWSAKTPGQNWVTPGGDFLPTPAATTANIRTQEGWAYFSPTQLVQQWVSGQSANYGVMLVEAAADASGSYANFDSLGSTDPTVLPFLQVHYAPPAGQRRDDTYLTESLNDRTTMGVGVASGNLLLSSQDIKIAGLGQPLSFARSYNSGLVDYKTGAFGNGGTGGLTGDVHLTPLDDGGMGLGLGDGSYYRYNRDPGGGYKPAARLEADLLRNPDGTHELTYRRSQSKWRFRTDGKLSQIVDKHQNTITLGYAATGALNQITDTQGRVLPVTMNAAGQITQIADPSGRSWTYTYAGTASNLLATFTDPSGGVTRYAYDSANRLTKLTTPGGRVTQISYDADGRVSEYIRITDPDRGTGPTTRVNYDQDSPRCKDTTTAAEQRRTTVVTDPRGNKTTYCISPELQVVLTIDPKGHEQATKYNPQGQVEKFTDGTGSAAAINNATYNGLSNVTSLEGPMKETTSFGYQDNPQSPTEKYQPTSQTSPDGQQQFFGYNTNGDVTSVKDSQNSPNQQATLTYNADGTIATAKDGENRQTTYGYWASTDGGNRKGLLKTFAPPAPRQATTLDYDALGRVRSSIDGNGNTTTYTYDKLDRVKTITQVRAGGETITYTYDPDGNQTQVAQTNMGTETAAYDELNRRVSETLASGRTTSYGYDAAGNLNQVADQYGITGYGYDEMNRSCYVAPTDAGGGSCVAPPSGATTFEYDAAGHQTYIHYPNGINVYHEFDISGKPRMFAAGPGTNPIGTGPNNASSATSYRAFSGGRSGTQVAVKMVHGRNMTVYLYDGSDRLQSMELFRIGDISGPPVDKVTYTYDKAGNRTGFSVAANSKNTIAPYTATSTYNGANQLVTQTRNTKTDGASSKTFSYDGQGNDASYTWNARNQLVGGGTYGTFRYRGPNQADLRDDDGYAIESNLLGISRRYAPNDNNPTAFMRGPDGELLARKDPTGAWSYYVGDYQGSIIGVYNASGTLTRKYDYDPDGNTWRDSSGKPEDFGYTGAYTRLGAQTLYKNGLRWYDPKTARWTSADSLDQPGDLKNANPYQYVGSNPLNGTDPTGQNFADDIKAGISSAYKHGKAMVKGAGKYAGTWGGYGLVGGCLLGSEVAGGVGCRAGGTALGTTTGLAGGAYGGVRGLLTGRDD